MKLLNKQSSYFHYTVKKVMAVVYSDLHQIKQMSNSFMSITTCSVRILLNVLVPKIIFKCPRSVQKLNRLNSVARFQ